MRNLVYDVAMTLDSYICRPDGSVEGMALEGEHADEYLARLGTYETAIMGRKTYEWGYSFGLQPGTRPYPHMDCHIFSSTLQFDTEADVEISPMDPAERVRQLKSRPGGDIYLCGGGELAGCLLESKLIDRWLVKLNPVVFGRGVPVFGESKGQADLRLESSKAYSNGVVLLEYTLR